jgi:tetratricopeptide (TPR) repeat protein
MAAVLEAEEPDTRGLLHRLTGRSLLTQTGDGRWRLHPLLREFVAEELPADDPAWGRMAAYYVQVAGAADDLYLRGGADLLRGLALFDLEWPHIRAGQAWAAARAETEDKVTHLCSAYPDAAAHCLDLRLSPSGKIPWLEAAVQAARRLEDRGAEGVHLGNLGNAYAALGEMWKAIGYYEQALGIDCKIGNRRGEGAALGNLGNAYTALGEARRAIGYCEQALEIAREIGDRRGEGNRLGSLGLAYAALGEVRKAIGYCEQALDIAREIGDRQAEGVHLGNLGLAYADLGEVREAIGYYEQALEIRREIGDRRGEGNDLANMGLAYKKLGDAARARELWEEALCIYEAIEDPYAKTVRGWLAEPE